MKFYRDNRIVPPIIAFVTICLLWKLIDPSARLQVSREGTQKAETPWTRGSLSDQGNKAAYQDSQIPATGENAGAQHGAGGRGSSTTLDADDVLLILKTGATVLWKRLPIHLATTLSPERISPENTVIYSEVEAQIGRHKVIDILSQMPQSVKDSPDFETYHAIRDWDAANLYTEQTGLPGDDEGPPGGWRLDKHKFLPLMAHAGTHWARAKWYLYTEDDTYLFLPNVLRYLSAYDHRESHWLGGLGEKLGTTFAHGGSGFALSRAAWEQSFHGGGGGLDLVRKYQGFVDAACCGDYALGKVLNDFGVKFGENNGDEKWSWGFNGLPHWKTEFSRENWCKPVLTWHHAHVRDIARYHELERSWDFSKRALNYGDFYASVISPALAGRKGWWDNLSGRYEVHSTTSNSAPRPDGKYDEYDDVLWANAWKSDDSCEAACRGWSRCVQWYYYGDDCKMDDRVFMGHGWPDGMRYRKDKLESISGWLTDRIDTWTCD